MAEDKDTESQWFGNLINAIIFQIIGGIDGGPLNLLMNLFGAPEWGYEMLVSLDMFPPEVASVEIQFN